MKIVQISFIFFLCFFSVSCSIKKNSQLKLQPATSISRLQFLGQYLLPHHMQFKNTTVGGLSGIDYDANTNLYYVICDDRSVINSARFYTIKINLSARGIKKIKFIAVKKLKQENGKFYPNSKQNPYKTPDPEAIRYNPITNRLVWSSEGERVVNNGDTILVDPTLTVMATNGEHNDAFPLPQNLKMQTTQKGPRQNGVLEGLTYADNYQTLYASLEVPLYDDAPKTNGKEDNYLVRIYKFQVKNKQNLAQYAYKLDVENGRGNPGITDILDLGNTKLLVTERSYAEENGFSAKIFVADLSVAENVSKFPSLLKNPPQNLISKRLLLDTDDLKMYIDNIEGVTFGPNLPNGHRSLIVVTDNNFNSKQRTQFLMFEIFP